jgi:hypothetical protein
VKEKLQNFALVAVIVLVGVLIAEATTRHLDNLPVFAVSFPQAFSMQQVTAEQRDRIALAPGVAPQWFFDNPPEVPSRTEPSADWLKRFEEAQQAERSARASGPVPFQPANMFRAWNSVWARDPCKEPMLAGLHARALYFFDPPDGSPYPRYRYYPNATTPGGLVTNEIGWRGPPLRPLTKRTVRIVFVGASTTAGTHGFPWSYPEFIDHWLALWARSKNLDVDFQGLNAARESIFSTDNVAVVRNEVVPMQPDLVVYYEGANQFFLESLVPDMPPAKPPSVTLAETAAPPWLQDLTRYSALARRVEAALGAFEDNLDGREPVKPDYRLKWPEGLDENDPQLDFPDLPVNLNTIQADLDRMRADLATVDAEFAVSSFAWFAKDGMVLDPVRHKYILQFLNRTKWPFRYRDIARLSAFQNRVFKKYAAVHGLPFIDVARNMPSDPDLYSDAIHNTLNGLRVRAWVVFQQLVPIIERRLASGQWPKRTERVEHRPLFHPKERTLKACN